MSKYENKVFINQYLGIWAYGYVNGFTGTEAVYRIVKSFVMEEFNKEEKLEVLDIGCGVGRSTKDLAEYLKKSQITAVDSSELSISMAKEVLFNNTKKCKEIDLNDVGIGILNIPTYNFQNLKLINSSYEEACIENKYDLIVSINFLDRCECIDEAIDNIYIALKDGGVFIATTPLNFTKNEQWVDIKKNKSLKNKLEKKGFKIKEYLNDVPYREILDGRKAYNEFYVDILKVQK